MKGFPLNILRAFFILKLGARNLAGKKERKDHERMHQLSFSK